MDLRLLKGGRGGEGKNSFRNPNALFDAVTPTRKGHITNLSVFSSTFSIDIHPRDAQMQLGLLLQGAKRFVQYMKKTRELGKDTRFLGNSTKILTAPMEGSTLVAFAYLCTTKWLLSQFSDNSEKQQIDKEIYELASYLTDNVRDVIASKLSRRGYCKATAFASNFSTFVSGVHSFIEGDPVLGEAELHIRNAEELTRRLRMEWRNADPLQRIACLIRAVLTLESYDFSDLDDMEVVRQMFDPISAQLDTELLFKVTFGKYEFFYIDRNSNPSITCSCGASIRNRLFQICNESVLPGEGVLLSEFDTHVLAKHPETILQLRNMPYHLQQKQPSLLRLSQVLPQIEAMLGLVES